MLGGDVFVGEGWRHVARTIQKFARTDLPVLIQGETGTGKELAARALHELSRPHAPFVAINCAAIPESLFESELFGHARGAFTHAVAARKGALLVAEVGTVFLDEIAELSLTAQAKLLRVLETRSFRPVGADQERTIRTRFVAATHVQLKNAVEEGRFRRDLYARLNVLKLTLPSLADHPDDIPPLVEHLKARLPFPLKLRADAIRWLTVQPWSGNTRELLHLLERASVEAEGAIVTAHDLLSLHEGDQEPLMPLHKALALRKAELVEDALARHRGNITRAANALGVGRAYLRKLKRQR